ncbi:DUF1127 domain-containing protein [Aeromonas rivuli]|jgi:uncharacterized protein YjiS (DUF1127 family)|uniref:YjiS-like domain-containing protein n=1 Tax=Aeromonas molluscorum 848 TaxID=1268236 RepID=R1GYY5_9GAMM|nr:MULTISPECIES: DUF1127 domain-containing protein [Aeromonas]EOD56680.1 hypothetical protein G113_02349 [Aeromonas molluscorum 848]MCS3457694.1 uncharacterized protein YjiS (DUF1127 family) [Aeromonas sp. BIGb0405]MCS3461714.1 uncharacterized protein YjiS (DUF1127 family) [Aeromonas sp. BIGb0445]UBO74818.1 DUF1127 domain-containing protein [Aeromonas rivuli]
MSIELTLLRGAARLIEFRITRIEQRRTLLNLSPALLKDIGLEGEAVQVSHLREREYQTDYRLGNRIT